MSGSGADGAGNGNGDRHGPLIGPVPSGVSFSLISDVPYGSGGTPSPPPPPGGNFLLLQDGSSFLLLQDSGKLELQ